MWDNFCRGKKVKGNHSCTRYARHIGLLTLIFPGGGGVTPKPKRPVARTCCESRAGVKMERKIDENTSFRYYVI